MSYLYCVQCHFSSACQHFLSILVSCVTIYIKLLLSFHQVTWQLVSRHTHHHLSQHNNSIYVFIHEYSLAAKPANGQHGLKSYTEYFEYICVYPDMIAASTHRRPKQRRRRWPADEAKDQRGRIDIPPETYLKEKHPTSTDSSLRSSFSSILAQKRHRRRQREKIFIIHDQKCPDVSGKRTNRLRTCTFPSFDA